MDKREVRRLDSLADDLAIAMNKRLIIRGGMTYPEMGPCLHLDYIRELGGYCIKEVHADGRITYPLGVGWFKARYYIAILTAAIAMLKYQQTIPDNNS